MAVTAVAGHADDIARCEVFVIYVVVFAVCYFCAVGRECRLLYFGGIEYFRGAFVPVEYVIPGKE